MIRSVWTSAFQRRIESRQCERLPTRGDLRSPLCVWVSDGESVPPLFPDVPVENPIETLGHHRLKGRRKSVVHRLRIAQSREGKKHSVETREKISNSQLKKRRTPVASDSLSELAPELNPMTKNDGLVLDKAVLELSELRKDVIGWLETWYVNNDHKPSLDEVERISPEIHNKFLRYIALQEFIRSIN